MSAWASNGKSTVRGNTPWRRRRKKPRSFTWIVRRRTRIGGNNFKGIHAASCSHKPFCPDRYEIANKITIFFFYISFCVQFLHLLLVCVYQCMCTCICLFSTTHSVPSIVSSPKSIFKLCQKTFLNSSSTSQLSFRSNLKHRPVPSGRNAANNTCWYMLCVFDLLHALKMLFGTAIACTMHLCVRVV